MSKFFFDTEFIDDGKTIELLSIGICHESGVTYYAENAEADTTNASEWVKENVFPHLGKTIPKLQEQIRDGILSFVEHYHTSSGHIEFWAYYGAYDWVALCQLFGTMMDLPHGWPQYHHDIKQLCNSLGNPRLPKQLDREHHAVEDARWNMKVYNMLISGELTNGR